MSEENTIPSVTIYIATYNRLGLLKKAVDLYLSI